MPHSLKALLSAASVTLLSTLLPHSLQADLCVSTLTPPQSGFYGDVSTSDWAGFAFTTDDNTYQLDTVTTRLIFHANPTGWTLNASIFQANSSGVPISDTSLGSFSHSSLSSPGDTDVIFSTNAPIILAANTTYLFALTLTDSSIGNNLSWYLTGAPINGDPGVPGSNWLVPGVIMYKDTLTQGPWKDEGEETLVFLASVSATEAIPEPSTWVALLSGAAALLGARRLRR